MHREPIVVGRKHGLISMVRTRRKKETSNQKRMKKQELGKNEERLRNLQDILKCSNIQIIEVLEEKKKSKKLKKTYLNK